MAKKKKAMAPGERVGLYISRIVVWIGMLFALIPIYFVVRASFSLGTAFYQTNPFDWSNLTLANYQSLEKPFSSGYTFAQWLGNTFLIATLTSLVQVFITVTAAFAFSRMKFWGRRYGLMFLLLLQMFPTLMSATAYYIALSDIQGLNNLWWYMAILCGGSAYTIWLMKGYMDTVPRDLDEAAIVDGAGYFRIFWQIILPLALPMVVVVFIFSFIGIFTEYPLANLLLTSPDNYTVGLGLYWLLNPASHAQNFTQFSAAALVIAVPITVVYMIFQKWIVRGLTAGAVKG